MNKLWYIATLLFCAPVIFAFSSDHDIRVVERVFEETKKIKTLKFTLTKRERVDGKMLSQTSKVKLNRNPYMVYVNQSEPKEGVEVLYVNGQNDGKALVNPNGFPWVNVSLTPNSFIMRKDQHHTVEDAGFDLLISILEHLVQKYRTQIHQMISVQDTLIENYGKCKRIAFTNPYFAYVNYQVQAGENLHTIAKRFNICDHMILEKNKGIDDYEDVQAGQWIKIPNDYSPKMTLIVMGEKLIPVYMKVYDDLGLYEEYRYAEITVNPVIDRKEFQRDYEGYNF